MVVGNQRKEADSKGVKREKGLFVLGIAILGDVKIMNTVEIG